MSIIKNTPNILKHSGLSFTSLINKTLDAIKDPSALGIYVYLASKPADWEISETNLQRRFGKGRDFIRARLSELKLLGLLKSVAIKNERGQIIRWETMLFNEVQSSEIKGNKDKTQFTENPPSGKSRGLVDPPTTNKRSKKIKDNKKPPSPPKVNDDEGVLDTETMLRNNPHEIKEQVIKDWQIVRRKKKAPITQTAWDRVNECMDELISHGVNANECFTSAVAGGWTLMETRYFQKEIEESKKNNYKKIILREKESAERKKMEIESSKNFEAIVSHSMQIGPTRTEYEKNKKSIASNKAIRELRKILSRGCKISNSERIHSEVA